MRYPVLILSILIIAALLFAGCVEEPEKEPAATPAASSTTAAITTTATPEVTGPVVISGTGSNVHTFTATVAGAYVIEATAQSTVSNSGDFTLYITESGGNSYSHTGNGIVFNELAEPLFRGTKTVQLAARKYIVTVDSHCDYHIVISRA